MKKLIVGVALLIGLLGMQSSFYKTYTTSFFRIKYEKTVSSKSVTRLGTLLEADYAKYKKKFSTTVSGRIDVTLYGSAERMRSDANIAFYNDGFYLNGKIYAVEGAIPSDESKSSGVVARVAARCALNEIKGCPYWLAECYSVYAGEELAKYGRPSRPSMSSFADLAEDFSGAERTDEYKEVYAKLAATASFFITRYGETKFEGVFSQLKLGKSMEESFEASFGEKFGTIEKAWSKSLAGSPK